MATVRFTSIFKRRFKGLKKRYRNIQSDLQPILRELEDGHFVGNRISGTTATVFKVRAPNSNIPTGKSGGYRLIYRVDSPKLVVLLLIYAKSDRADISTNEILAAIEAETQE